MRAVKAEATAAGTLKTPVCNQLKYGHAINFAVGRPDWNPAFALAQMTVYRGKTAVLTIRVFAKEKPHGWMKIAAQPSSLSAQKGLTCHQLFCFPWMDLELNIYRHGVL